MASRAGCKTIVGCLTLLQTWIYEYFPAFRPHPRQVDVPNKTRAEMWSTQKPVCELSRLRDCRSILDSMTETRVLYITSDNVIHFILTLEYLVYANFACEQLEWTSYITSLRELLNVHPRIAYIGGITCFDIVEVYLPEKTIRQLGFVQAIPPSYETYPRSATSTGYLLRDLCYTEAWSRFPYCARFGDQALRRAFVPSEVVPNYFDWFRVSSYPFLFPRRRTDCWLWSS